MNKLKSSLGAKIGAALLFMICFAASLAGAAGIVYLEEQGAYSSTGFSYDNSDSCSNITYNYASDVYYNYLPLILDKEPTTQESYRIQQKADAYSAENTNFFFAVSDNDGKVVLTNYDGEKYGYMEVYSFDDGYDENGDAVGGGAAYTVTAYVRNPITAYDDYYNSYHSMSILNDQRYTLIAATVSAAVITVLLFVFLMAAAGHRKGREGISLSGLDRIPLDLYAAAVFLVGLFTLYVCGSVGNYYNIAWEIMVIGVVAVLLGLLAIVSCMTLAARLKAGAWYRNTLIYMIGKGLGKAIGSVFSNLPLLWKWILVFGVYFFLNIATLMGGFAGGSGLLALMNFGLNLAVLFGLCWFALQLDRLKKGGERIAGGDYETKIDTKNMYGDVKAYADTLNDIGGGMSRAVEERLKSERLKAELITNVSHDIKTPLTSIVNYVDLLKKEEIENEVVREYVDVLDRQSAKLKKLTEDLVEASKASTGNVSFQPERVVVAEFLDQLLAEYGERLAARELSAVVGDAGDAAIEADGRLLWRIFDNLLGNICKYALAGTRVYFDVARDRREVRITLKNISGVPLNISADELMERFVRGDSARGGDGSGLGLSIARSLTELQGGRFALLVDGDLFKVVLSFDSVK